MVSHPSKMKSLTLLPKSFYKMEIEIFKLKFLSALFDMKTKFCLKYFLNNCLWKLAFNFNSLKGYLNLIC